MSDTTAWTVLNEAHAALRTSVGDVPADAWDLVTPCAEWNVTQVLQHAAGDQLAFASALTGGPGPAENPFAPSGKMDGSPEAMAEEAMKASANAWANVAEDAEEVTVPVPPGKLAAPVGVGACALDAGVHAWDIAIATGRPSPLTPRLARDLMPVAKAIVEPLRAYGAYAAALEPEAGDDDAAALLRYLGRRPDWTTGRV